MYERFYNLRERPFSLTPDPGYLYPSRVHREALSHLRYGIESHAGFVVITGEIGCGKTTLLQTVIRGLDQQASIARLVNTALDARELIEAVMLDFGLEPRPDSSKPYLLRDLARYLVDQRAAGRLALLLVDEAQNLTVSALEEIRMLSNLETEKSKLIQIVLVGQPNLKDLLDRPELVQLRQRVTVNYHLEPLGAEDTHQYVNHRLRRAAVGTPLEFPREVTDLIFRATGGVARTVNVIADGILLFGYGADKHAIDAELAREVIRELGAEPLIEDPTPAPSAVAARAMASPPAQMPDLKVRPTTDLPDLKVRPTTDLPDLKVRPATDLPDLKVRPATDLPDLKVRPATATTAPAWPQPHRRDAGRARRFDLPLETRALEDLAREAVDPPLARPAPATTRFPASTYRVLGEPAKPSPGVWTKLRRIFGVPKPVFEDQKV